MQQIELKIESFLNIFKLRLNISNYLHNYHKIISISFIIDKEIIFE